METVSIAIWVIKLYNPDADNRGKVWPSQPTRFSAALPHSREAGMMVADKKKVSPILAADRYLSVARTPLTFFIIKIRNARRRGGAAAPLA